MPEPGASHVMSESLRYILGCAVTAILGAALWSLLLMLVAS